MNSIRIKDIYAGMPDAKDEIETYDNEFYASFILPPELPVDKLLDGKKFLVSGYKGTGKTSVLYYLQNEVVKRDPFACTSFIYFKSEYKERDKSSMQSIAKKMISIVDTSCDDTAVQEEYLDLWKWVFFKKIVDDSCEFSDNLFENDSNWDKFVKEVNKISFTDTDKSVISLSSLSIGLSASTQDGLGASVEANFDRKNKSTIDKIALIIVKCEKLFSELKRTDIPYYIFVDEMEAYYGDNNRFIRDLTLLRDLIFTTKTINRHKDIHVIAAVRTEILSAMDRFIQTKELNKTIEGFSVPIKWSYSNTNSVDHPIIKILTKRISMATPNIPVTFFDWFPQKIDGKNTINYILDNGWNKPRDIVRLIIAAQNDSLHCNESFFSQAVFDSLKKEYSRNSLAEIRQELQALYTSQEIDLILKMFRGRSRYLQYNDIRKYFAKGSEARRFWDERGDAILEDLYRIGFIGNVNRTTETYRWRWNHKGDSGFLNVTGWDITIHPALFSELSIVP